MKRPLQRDRRRARRLATLAIALLISAALGSELASAGYMKPHLWTHMSALERAYYVAGVVDAIQAMTVTTATIGSERAALLLSQADTCTDPLRLGDALTLATRAIATHPDMGPARALLLELATCSRPPGSPRAPHPDRPTPSTPPSPSDRPRASSIQRVETRITHDIAHASTRAIP